jgi:uracil-DNA glycosylase
MNKKGVHIEESWRKVLLKEFDKEYFRKLSAFVHDSYGTKEVFPHPKNIFKAFDLCPFDSIKVVLIGQDPYHGKGQAIGLSFAVSEQTTLPPSLKNIFKEIENDLSVSPIPNGNLERWATQGVLLLNATLTVESGKPGSHQKQGWEEFTDAVIQKISSEKEHVVFILWGNYAKQKGAHIDRTKHYVIESPHPSPFSAHTGFFGSKPFSKTNTYLKNHNLPEIDWR